MDPLSAATQIVAYLTPIAVDKGVELAKKVGEDVVDKLADWLDGLRRRWADDPEATKAVEDFVAEPKDEARRAELKDVLADRMQSDPSLLESAEQLKERVGPYLSVVLEADKAGDQTGAEIGNVRSGTIDVSIKAKEADSQTGFKGDSFG